MTSQQVIVRQLFYARWRSSNGDPPLFNARVGSKKRGVPPPVRNGERLLPQSAPSSVAYTSSCIPINNIQQSNIGPHIKTTRDCSVRISSKHINNLQHTSATSRNPTRSHNNLTRTHTRTHSFNGLAGRLLLLLENGR